MDSHSRTTCTVTSEQGYSYWSEGRGGADGAKTLLLMGDKRKLRFSV